MEKLMTTTFLEDFNGETDYEKVHGTFTFEEYLNKVQENPAIVRNAYQRVFDMIDSYGTVKVKKCSKEFIRHKFFDGDFPGNKDKIFGLEGPLEKLVMTLKSAAQGMGPERRIILLHGPVGSSKSTIVRMIKKGYEHYSKTEEGALYTFQWCLEGPEERTEASEWLTSPMNDEPLKLIPEEFREEFVEALVTTEGRYPVEIEGNLNPSCRFNFSDLQERYDGDWKQVIKNHVRVVRVLVSEKDRVGIGTFQPKDEKNQDSTELTGDINYRKIAIYGSDSDPRAFNFDGEFNVANRGIMEFVEVLKLETAFLYDLLGATQEHKIKPKKFAQTDIDEVILAHTNEAELKKLQNNELMEAFRDRTVRIDIPYLVELNEEVKIYERDFSNSSKKLGDKFIAPHTVKIAALWAILTRLEQPDNQQLSLMQKLKLYNGKSLPGFTSDNIRELKEGTKREGLDGISPRYIQDKISEAIVTHYDAPSVNPFMVMNSLEAGLKYNTLINDKEFVAKCKNLLGVVKEEYEDIIKNEVQKAIAADDDAIARLASNYIDNLKAYTSKEKVRNPYTGKEESPNERLMRSIEEKIDIPESRKDDFRREIMNYIGSLALDGKQFKFYTNERLQKALELKLFEDQKDTIKLQNILSQVIDKDTQEKINIVKTRLIKNYGYDEHSATDVLNYVASIYARGDVKG
jgi:serine protein kinase